MSPSSRVMLDTIRRLCYTVKAMRQKKRPETPRATGAPRLNLRVPPDIYEQLRTLAEREDRTMANVAVRAIKQYLANG